MPVGEFQFQVNVFSRTRSIGFSFHVGALGVNPCSPDVVQPSATLRNRSHPSATVRMIALWPCQWGSAERVSLMTCDVLFSLALCVVRSFSSLTCRFAAQAPCFGRLLVLVAVPVGVAIQGWLF